MSLSSLVKTFDRLSPPKKLVTGTVAIAGIAALISIPVISLRPPRQPAVFNEDAYYQHQVSEQSPVGEQNISSPVPTSLDTTTTPTLTVPNESATPGVNSASTKTTTELGTTVIPTSRTRENFQTPNNAGNIGSTDNPDNKPTTSSYTPPSSFSTNPDNLSSSDSSYLKTPYSLPIPNIGSSAKPYSLQPSLGNSYTSPSNQSNPSSYNSPGTASNPSTATTPTTTPSIPSEPAIAPNTLNGPN